MFAADPMLVPLLLALGGVATAALAATRRRRARAEAAAGVRVPRLVGRAVVVGYVVATVLLLAVAGVEAYQRGSVFWDARWEGGDETLVLEHWGPIPDVALARGEIETITEFSNRERHMFERRRTTRFMLATRAGATHWSAPLTSKSEVSSLRERLIVATDRRLQRFIVGSPESD